MDDELPHGWCVFSHTGSLLEYGFWEREYAERWATRLGLDNYTISHATERDEYEDFGSED